MKGLLSNCHNTQPIITRVTMDQSNVKKGLPLLLRCEASGIPSPRIEWQAPNGDVYRMMKDDFEGFIRNLRIFADFWVVLENFSNFRILQISG